MSKPSDLHESLQDTLTKEELEELPTSFDIVGDIAILKLPDSLLDKKEEIGKGLMEVHGHLSTVLLQTSPVSGEYRTRDLEIIAGESKTETVHREHGCSFKVDLSKAYFSPRLAHERFRIAKKVKTDEVVTNMFAGVGCYSVLIAKHAQPEKVYSIDKNSAAVEYMKENIRTNKTSATVIPIEGDAREAIEEHLQGVSDRVLMPLPEFARDFFDAAIQTLKSEGGIIHFYDYGEEPDPFESSLEFARENVEDREIKVREKNIVRSYAPNLYHVVLDLELSTTEKQE